ncbi:MAG: AGE family epimerase/isomerase, partial [Bacteroidales bacterium]|nr:AGE family epimerase/isomerase [Bacteroidales bacterium]
MFEAAEVLKQLKNEINLELNNILNYWSNTTVDKENGGFYGRITEKDQLVATFDKGVILNTRILWTFSSSFQLIGKKEYLAVATRAKDYLINHFWDKKFAGVYWMLDFKGNPVNKKKQIYAQAFAIYALSEYYRVTGDCEALDYAIWLFELIEQCSYDSENPGYFEA